MSTPVRISKKRISGIALSKWTLLPPFFAVLLFLVPAFLLQLYFSVHAWTVYLTSWWDAEFVRLEMFWEVLTDKRFLWAFVRSFTFAGLSTLGCFLTGFGLALLMYRPFKGHGFFYASFILPMLTVAIVIAYTFEMLLYQKGPLNGILSAIFGTDISVMWLTNPSIAAFTVVFLEIWNWTPFAFVLMLAGLAALPRELTEAAQSLGAGCWQIFREIQLPLLRPVILLVLILRFLEAMGEFAKTWAFLQGGPGSTTETIPLYLYLTTWQFFRVSKGAAMSYIVMVVMVVIVLLAIRALRREKQALDRMDRRAGGPP